MNKKCFAVTLMVLAFILAFPPVGEADVFDFDIFAFFQAFEFSGFKFFLSSINEMREAGHETLIIRYDLLLLEVLIVIFLGLGVSLIVGD